MKKLIAVMLVLICGQNARSEQMTITRNPATSQAINFTFNNVNHYAYAGALQASLNGGPQFDVFCVDINAVIYPPTTYAISNLITNANNFSLVAKVLAHSSYSNAVESAGVQLAVWKSLYDGASSDFNSGSFRANTSLGTVAYATTLLNASLGDPNNYAVNLYQATNGGQSMVNAASVSVPEPSTLVMLLSTAPLFIFLRKGFDFVI